MVFEVDLLWDSCFQARSLSTVTPGDRRQPRQLHRVDHGRNTTAKNPLSLLLTPDTASSNTTVSAGTERFRALQKDLWVGFAQGDVVAINYRVKQ